MVLEAFASVDHSLAVLRDAFLVLYLLLDHVDGVGGFDLESNCLAVKILDENKHACLIWLEIKVKE